MRNRYSETIRRLTQSFEGTSLAIIAVAVALLFTSAAVGNLIPALSVGDGPRVGELPEDTYLVAGKPVPRNLPPGRLPGGRPNVAKAVHGYFDNNGYELDRVRQGGMEVPPLFLSHMPRGLDSVKDVGARKRVFLRVVLPLVLEVNRRIERRRRYFLQLRQRMAEGGGLAALDAREREWLDAMTDRYRVKKGEWDKLKRRLDGVPPSLALAQAATESGWGTSRFAREGNALYGQWTWDAKDTGMVPLQRGKGKTHRIRTFPNLLASVRGYVNNLNTHRAYKKLRDERTRLRRQGKGLDGPTLARTLDRYSERGQAYIDDLLTIMKANDLAALDAARLSGGEREAARLLPVQPS